MKVIVQRNINNYVFHKRQEQTGVFSLDLIDVRGAADLCSLGVCVRYMEQSNRELLFHV